MFGLTSDQKLDVLIILFSIWLVLAIFSAAYNFKLFVSGKNPSKSYKRLTIRENKGDYAGMLEIANWFLQNQPENIEIKWAKARALYKLKRYNEAKKVFKEVANSEPLLASDANKYLDSISEKST